MMILRASDRAAVLWKNGGGVTHEIAIQPSGAAIDDFLWRVSIAEVASAGPFSMFPGVDRRLAVLHGALRLNTAGREAIIDTDAEPFALAGEVTTHGEPIGGPVTDLNVMTRRGRYQADIRLSSGVVTLAGETIFVVARHATTICKRLLEQHDALRLDNVSGEHLDVGPVPVLLVEISTTEGQPSL